MSTSTASSTKHALRNPLNPGSFSFPGITPSSSASASSILAHNHTSHHIFFNDEQFHNHIVHYVLAMYDLGAPAPILNNLYEREKVYQRQLELPGTEGKKAKTEIVKSDLENGKWEEYLDKQEYYSDWMQFFEREAAHLGWEGCCERWIFGKRGEVKAEDKDKFGGRLAELREKLWIRLFAGFYHPFIHLGYGIEFGIPEIVAEALAQTAVHDEWIGDLLTPAESRAREANNYSTANSGYGKTLSQLAEELRGNSKVLNGPQWSDGNKIKGLISRAAPESLSIVSQYTVPDASLIPTKTAESINASAYLCCGATRPGKAIKFCFYLMHGVTSSLFLGVFAKQDWISDEVKARLIEWKGRTDLALYASRRVPEIRLGEIKEYVPKIKAVGSQWMNTVDRGIAFEDTSAGHCIKMIRALAYGERICREYEGKPGFEIKGDMWEKLGAMCIDALENREGPDWVRSAGFDEAWKEVGPRKVYGDGIDGAQKGLEGVKL